MILVLELVKMANILIFGDSITWGAWDKEGGWVQRLRKFLDEKNLLDPKHDYMVYNLGVSGDSSIEVLERFEHEVKVRISENETIIIFAIGLNDSHLINETKLRVSLSDFRLNLEKLFKLSKKSSSNIIFLGLTPVDDSKVDPMPWAPEKSYRNDSVKEFDETIKSFCKKEEIHFIDVFGKLIQIDYKKLLEDGAHPNSEGHKKIFEIIIKYLEKNKILK